MRIDHINIVVADMARSRAFYAGLLGMTVTFEAELTGEWIETVTGLPGVAADCFFCETPGGGVRLELLCYRTPPGVAPAARLARQHARPAALRAGSGRHPGLARAAVGGGRPVRLAAPARAVPRRRAARSGSATCTTPTASCWNWPNTAPMAVGQPPCARWRTACRQFVPVRVEPVVAHFGPGLRERPALLGDAPDADHAARAVRAVLAMHQDRLLRRALEGGDQGGHLARRGRVAAHRQVDPVEAQRLRLGLLLAHQARRDAQVNDGADAHRAQALQARRRRRGAPVDARRDGVKVGQVAATRPRLSGARGSEEQSRGRECFM